MSNPSRRLHATPGAAGRLDRSAVLAGGIPDAFAGTVFDPADPRMAGAFSARSESVLRTGSLPVPMQREVSWWLATCQDNGERVVNTNDWRRWAATAAEVAAARPQVRSLADLTMAEWMAEWSRKFHADHGRLPSPGTRAKAATAMRGLLPAWPSTTATPRGGSTTCGACGSTRGSPGARTSPTETPWSAGTTSSRPGCGKGSSSTRACSRNPARSPGRRSSSHASTAPASESSPSPGNSPAPPWPTTTPSSGP